MAHIYEDEQTRRYLEDLKDKNPDFNLSKFVKQALKDYSGFDEDISIDKINHELTQAQHDLKKAQDRIEYLNNQKIKFLANERVQSDKKNQDLAESTARILKYCDVSEKEAEELAKDYYNHPNKSITNFLDEKGVELKHTQQLKGGNNT
jgi:septal ring factor EnvC (AmiA/AmiB activator)